MSTTLTTAVGSSSSKKRKQNTHDVISGPSPKKPKRDKKLKKKKSVSGVAEKDSKTRHCEFSLVRASLVVSLAPVFVSNPRAGVEEMLDSMVMRYIPSLGGVVLLHSNLQFQQPNATIQGDCPFATCHITFDAMVWNPTVGMQLSGKLNLCSPDHISLLVHRTFNVSIPKHHIPLDQWHFEYGPAENDPEFWNGTHGEDPDPDADTMMMQLDENNENGEDTDKSMGKWVRTDTGEKIGSPSGVVSFTVIGTTVANQMLSLVGSLQPDPFSPTHVLHQIPQTKKFFATSPSPSPLRSPSPHPLQTAVEDDDDDDDDDLLAALSPSKDESLRTLELAQNIQGKKSAHPKQEPDQGQNRPGAADDEQNVDMEAEKARKAERKRKRHEEKALAKEQLAEGERLPGKKKKTKTKTESP